MVLKIRKVKFNLAIQLIKCISEAELSIILKC